MKKVVSYECWTDNCEEHVLFEGGLDIYNDDCGLDGED